MRKTLININGREFKTKKQMQEYFQKMLHSYEKGEEVSETHRKELYELISQHPNARLKMMPGIAGFSVAGAAYGTKCFMIKKIDGTMEDFSFYKCIRATK